MSHIVDRVITSYPELALVRKKAIIENYPSTFGLIKENLMVKLKENTTKEQRL